MKKILIIFISLIIVFIVLTMTIKYHTISEIRDLRNKVCSSISEDDLYVEIDIAESDVYTKYLEIFKKDNHQLIKKYDREGNLVAEKYNELNNPVLNEQIFYNEETNEAKIRYTSFSLTNMQRMLGIYDFANELSDKVDIPDDVIDDPLEYFATIDGNASISEYMRLPINVRTVHFNNEECLAIEASDGVSTTQRILYVNKKTGRPIGIKKYTPGVEDIIYAYKYREEPVKYEEVDKPKLKNYKVVTFADDILLTDKTFEQESEKLASFDNSGKIFGITVEVSNFDKLKAYNITPRNDNISIIAVNNYLSYQRLKQMCPELPEFTEKDLDNYQIDILFRNDINLQYDNFYLSNDKTVNVVLLGSTIDGEGKLPEYVTVIARPYNMVLQSNLNNINAILKRTPVTIFADKAIEIANKNEADILKAYNQDDTYRIVEMRDELINFRQDEKKLFYKPSPLENFLGGLLNVLVSGDPNPTCWAVYYDVFKGDEKQPSDGIIVYVNANSGELVGASTLN